MVICDTQHKILYMNPFACKHYETRGGAGLVGKSLLDCHNAASITAIQKILDWFREDSSHNRVHTFYNPNTKKDGYMVALRGESGELIGYYEKHAYRNRDMTPFYELT